MGGGCAAHALATAGLRTLVLERGRRIPDAETAQDERRFLIDRIASDDREIDVEGRRVRPLIGGLPGGGTALFGAALLRPSPEDFVPGRHYGDRIPRSIWEWPFGYEELEPYYSRAEELFRVSAEAGDRPPHLGHRTTPYPAPSPPLDPFNERLDAHLRRRGLAPFRLPLAIDFDRCLRCPICPGTICPNGARASTVTTLLDPLRRRHAVTLWEGFEAERFVHEGGSVRALRVRDRATGTRLDLTAERFLIAAGALATPALLERSELPGRSEALGRHHMTHLGALAVAVFPRSIGADLTFLKRLGLSDFYLGTRSLPVKLGSAQTIPIPGPLSLRAELGLPIPSFLARAIQARTMVFAGYVEDLPLPRNRVRARGEEGIRLERRFDPFDVLRGRHLARALADALRGQGAAVFSAVAQHDREHLAHQVGTCRAGRDPRDSVVDEWGRLHGQERVWVVDGSVLPTSLGVGPALTIAAHALRVTDRILERRPSCAIGQ